MPAIFHPNGSPFPSASWSKAFESIEVRLVPCPGLCLRFLRPLEQPPTGENGNETSNCHFEVGIEFEARSVLST